MMTPLSEVLYYPYFEPSELWLRRYLMVYDKILTVVPRDMQFTPSKGLSEIISRIDNSFSTISPTGRDKYADKEVLDRLDKAFRMISLKHKYPAAFTSAANASNKTFAISIHKWDGTVEIEGHSFLHLDKMSDEVRRLLEKYKLVNKPAADIVRAVGVRDYDQFIVVDSDAADLIVSHLANKIAKREGMSTITDKEVDFMVSSLNAIAPQQRRDRRAESMLASAVLKFELPAELDSISYGDYKKLRDNYSDIRMAFQEEIMRLNELFRLGDIENVRDLKSRIAEVTRGFDIELQKYKKSVAGRRVRRWLTLGVGGLATLAGAFANSRSFMVSSASVTVGVSFVQEILAEQDTTNEGRRILRLFSGLQKDIISKDKLRKLI